ncbi:MAG: thiamine-monophosphate kinase [Gemmatimonadota bacterium]
MLNTHGLGGEGFRPHQALGAGAEFDAIRALMARWGDLVVDIGDDAAVLPTMTAGVRVVSTDACIEDVHFRRAWITPREIGVRAAAAALSDLAAMGAEAECLLVAFVVPPSWRELLGEVADGIGDVVRRAGARIVGGNLSTGRTFGITCTVIGRAVRPVSRAGAQVGDLVLVTGTLGGPGAALAAFDEGQMPDSWSRERFARPVPRLREGVALAEAGVSAMLDVSDGLAADAQHLGAASGVGLRLDPARIPCGPGITSEQALVSGEEYELLATIPPHAWPSLAALWAVRCDTPLTVIGEVVDTAGGESSAGSSSASRHGFDHFSTGR